jgi:hypothetical protein
MNRIPGVKAGSLTVRATLAIVGAAAAALALTSPSTASAARAYMSCGFPPVISYGTEYDGSISYRRHPGKCHYSSDGSTAGLINLVDIHWKDWGEERARARAKRVDNHDMDRNGFQRHPVRVVLSALRPAVGHAGHRKLYYTKLRIVDRGNSGVIPLFRPGQGPIQLPEYRPLGWG